MSVFDKVERGGAIIVELPIYREGEVVARTVEIDVDGFLIPDAPTGRVGPDGLAVLSKLGQVGPDRFILAQASGRRDLCSNLSRIRGGILLGVDAFYIIYGDVRKGCGVSATKLIAEVKRRFPGVHVGAAISPERPGEERLLRRKLEAGADFFITQICFDARTLLDLVRKAGLRGPLLLALALNFGLESLRRMEGLGIHVPEDVRRRLSASGDPKEESARLAREVYEEVSEGYEGPLGVYLVPFGGIEGFRKMVSIFK